MLGDWFATALFWKPQVALVVNARTFLPVFMPLAPAEKLLDRLPDEVARILALHDVDPAVIDAERAAMTEVRITPTNDRSVVGVMNEFAFLAEHWFDGDLTSLSMRMAGTPVSPLRSGDGFPDQALATLVGDLTPRSERLAEVIPFPGMEPPTTTAAAPTKDSGAASPVIEGASPPSRAPSVFQLKVTLLNTKPPIWRRILVDGSITLADLHEVIQAAFGWWNCHLHEFEIGRTRYGAPDPDWDIGPPPTDESTIRLGAVTGEGTSFHYTYDFGDDWRHKVTVEKVGHVEPRTAVPDCIGGRRACPPEDCGGPWGYQDLLESLGGRPGASDARLDFVGPGFDPAQFDPSDFTFNLANVRNTSFDI